MTRCCDAPASNTTCRWPSCWKPASPRSSRRNPELVAHHYSEANVADRAVDYFQKAGERSLRMSANAEAIAHLSRGLEVLRRHAGRSRAGAARAGSADDDGPRADCDQRLRGPGSGAYLSSSTGAVPGIGRRATAVFGAARSLVLSRYSERDLDTAQTSPSSWCDIANGQHDAGLDLAAHRSLGYILSSSENWRLRDCTWNGSSRRTIPTSMALMLFAMVAPILARVA